MYPTPLALLPCRVVLGMAGLLVSRGRRREWKDEWFGELWQFASGANWGETLRVCWGCWADALWQCREERRLVECGMELGRSPGLCVIALSTVLLGVIAGTHGTPALRKLASPPPEGLDRLAVISRTGRMEAVRRAIPGDLAIRWKRDSRYVRSLAFFSFPFQLSGYGLAVRTSASLWPMLGVRLPADAERALESGSAVALVNARLARTAARRPGGTLQIGTNRAVIAYVLPEDFWFLYPNIAVFEVVPRALDAAGVLVVRVRANATTTLLERELEQKAEEAGYEFSSTAAHALFVRDAIQAPFWLFAAALFTAAVLAVLSYGSRSVRVEDAGEWLRRTGWRWWAFFAAKIVIGLAIVLLLGTELFVGTSQQTIGEELGGPLLIWFYVVGCSTVLFAAISDQRSRCRVCQRLLAFPIRIGCPGCMFLDWAGTEFLCPQGHGALYVPHHVTCWEENDRWVLLEAQFDVR